VQLLSGSRKKVLPKPNVLSRENEKATVLRALDVSIINHDLKTHLSPIKMCTEMLESHMAGPLNEKQDRMIRTIHSCINKLEALVGDVSDMYKLELNCMSLEKTELDIPDLMDKCANVLRPFIAEKQIELKIEFGAYGKIHADGRRMEQVLVHLVKNAIDYVPEIDGKITIKVEKTADSDILFCIEDNGEGVKPEDLGKIFDKFYKGTCKQSRKYGGSGIGLTICRGIIENHGGKIWLDSRHKNGTMFKFTIPLIKS